MSASAVGKLDGHVHRDEAIPRILSGWIEDLNPGRKHKEKAP